MLVIRSLRDATIKPDKVKEVVHKIVDKNVRLFFHLDYVSIEASWDKPGMDGKWVELKEILQDDYNVPIEKKSAVEGVASSETSYGACKCKPLKGHSVIAAVPGENGYLVLEQGDKYFLGSFFEDECELKDILQEKLLFDCGECRVVYPIP